MRVDWIQRGLLCAFLGLLAAGLVVGQQKPSPPVQHAPPRVVERKVTEMRRFDTPLARPTVLHPRPGPHPGHNWYWHQHYGWVAFPVAVAAPVAAYGVLPANYALPQTVYVPEQAAAACTIPCPHCGQPVTVQLGK